jgi:2-polyprenyl-3-methyl-5-hydroxy-6-metoxy-1,4-benzoquinol methylase
MDELNKTSVNLAAPTPYIESDSALHRFKRKLTYSFAFKWIRKFYAKTAAIEVLEIGTGSGFFLSNAHDLYPNARLIGIEYDPRLLAVTQARAHYAQVRQGNAETFDLNGASFDVIASFQVIEHLYQPSQMLTRVYTHLKRKGLFIVTTPNLDGWGARVMKNDWHGFRDDHVSLKGVAEWASLIESHGFKRVFCGSTFFSGIPILNKLPLGVFNWSLLVLFGAWPWTRGESFVGVFLKEDNP